MIYEILDLISRGELNTAVCQSKIPTELMDAIGPAAGRIITVEGDGIDAGGATPLRAGRVIVAITAQDGLWSILVITGVQSNEIADRVVLISVGDESSPRSDATKIRCTSGDLRFVRRTNKNCRS